MNLEIFDHLLKYAIHFICRDYYCYKDWTVIVTNHYVQKTTKKKKKILIFRPWTISVASTKIAHFSEF